MIVTEDLAEVVTEIAKNLTSIDSSRLVTIALRIALQALKHGRRRIAILADDIFQAVGVDKAEVYVKRFLNMIEYPPAEYENIVILVGSSEGVTRVKIGRHDWSEIYSLWNMSREGFRKLYDQLPGEKPSFEEIWKLTGGNPRSLSRLYTRNWNVEEVINATARSRNVRKLVRNLTPRQLELLRLAVEDPDELDKAILEAETLEEKEEVERLLNILVENNLVMELWSRGHGWIDEPPPEKDLVLGIGRYVAWQTPLHREAVRKVLEELHH